MVTGEEMRPRRRVYQKMGAGIAHIGPQDYTQMGPRSWQI
jgi:hypothetical protein